MKKVLILTSILFFQNLFAQEKIELAKQDGLVLSYSLTKLPGDNEKKDKYLFVIQVENTNDYDVYYETSTNTTSSTITTSGYAGIAEFKAQNSVGFLSTGLEYVVGQPTGLMTMNNTYLYKISKKSSATVDTKFSFKKDEKPIVTGKFKATTKKLEEFKLAVSSLAINGSWISNCGNIVMSLSLTKKTTGETVIIQTINGKVNEWIKTTANSFAKTTDRTTTLTYNSLDSTIIYNNPDGILCIWNKK